MDSKEYKEKLIQQILEFTEELRPTNPGNYIKEDGECPICGADDYFRLPEFHYARCNNCGHETGLSSFHTIIEARQIIYDNLMGKIKEALEK